MTNNLLLVIYHRTEASRGEMQGGEMADENKLGYPVDPAKDRYGNARSEPDDRAGAGPYILLGLLTAIGLIGGLLYFNGEPRKYSAPTEVSTPRQ